MHSLLLLLLTAVQVPLPEHPRPDFQRAEWLNLNGRWRFAFDPSNDGERRGWSGGSLPGTREIVVPFSWGAPLSGVPALSSSWARAIGALPCGSTAKDSENTRAATRPSRWSCRASFLRARITW